ncbi:uncharacterized protein B0H64DRAFT_128293 [Chaetomium fimeti]|uniref:Uncharacterized protein n=1 Tax=Chaetomium fimeti TaxID=1854472 RepID=A0AAE0HJJ8_9PEZI|nr:hypothetical protein B0H64DRAFT_128293 [Chaetomium fimeti]
MHHDSICVHTHPAKPRRDRIGRAPPAPAATSCGRAARSCFLTRRPGGHVERPIPDRWDRWPCGGPVWLENRACVALCVAVAPPSRHRPRRASRRAPSLTWPYMLSDVRLKWLHMPWAPQTSQMSRHPICVTVVLEGPRRRHPAVAVERGAWVSASSLSSSVGQRGVCPATCTSGTPDVTAGRRSHYLGRDLERSEGERIVVYRNMHST